MRSFLVPFVGWSAVATAWLGLPADAAHGIRQGLERRRFGGALVMHEPVPDVADRVPGMDALLATSGARPVITGGK